MTLIRQVATISLAGDPSIFDSVKADHRLVLRHARDSMPLPVTATASVADSVAASKEQTKSSLQSSEKVATQSHFPKVQAARMEALPSRQSSLERGAPTMLPGIASSAKKAPSRQSSTCSVGGGSISKGFSVEDVGASGAHEASTKDMLTSSLSYIVMQTASATATVGGWGFHAASAAASWAWGYYGSTEDTTS